MGGSLIKGLIGQEDLHLWNGNDADYTRLSSTGVVTMHPIGHMIDVLALYGNHVNFTGASIVAAGDQTTTTNKTLLLQPGTWTITSTMSVTCGLYIPYGAVLDLAAGVTLNLNKLFVDGLYQIFSGAGTVTFGSGAVKEVYPQWWETNTIPGTTDMKTAIQSAVDSLTMGGIVFFPTDSYIISSPIIITTEGITLLGAGKFTFISSSAASTDTIQIGSNDKYTSKVCVKNLFIIPGRYGINLNNTILGIFENLDIYGGTVGIYMRGQIETSSFRNLNIGGYSDYGILTGQLNTGSNPNFNFPFIQKSEFTSIFLQGAANSTGIKITGGFYLSQPWYSMHLNLTNITVQGGEKTALDISYTQSLTVNRIANEGTDPNFTSANTYSVIYIGNGNGLIEISNGLLVGNTGSRVSYKYVIDHRSGYLVLKNISIYGNAGTADIYMAGGAGGLIEMCRLTNGIIFANQTDKKTLLINVFDMNGILITDWPSGVIGIGGSNLTPGGITIIGNIFPGKDNTYYVGQKSLSYKGIVFKDKTNSHYYRIEIISGVLTVTDLGL